MTITAIHDDAGEIQGFAKVTRDLTERVRHERRLEQFAQAVSHDLRQPLRTLTIDLELLERRAGATLETDNEELLLESLDGAKRMQAMVNGLLEYVRLETVTQTTEAVECEAVVNDAIRDLAALIEERNADITVGPLPVVQVDREQLHVVFLNLLENAVKYTPDGPPEITVAAKQRTDGCQIAVSDTGMGIDPGKQEDIFKLFERSHRVCDTAGIGLGLALCTQVIEQHSGEIWVESTPGAGSTFYLRCPQNRDSIVPIDFSGLECTVCDYLQSGIGNIVQSHHWTVASGYKATDKPINVLVDRECLISVF